MGERKDGFHIGENQNISCDVVVVGSGAGGAATAWMLARDGWDVVMVEQGGERKPESFSYILSVLW